MQIRPVGGRVDSVADKDFSLETTYRRFECQATAGNISFFFFVCLFVWFFFGSTFKRVVVACCCLLSWFLAWPLYLICLRLFCIHFSSFIVSLFIFFCFIIIFKNFNSSFYIYIYIYITSKQELSCDFNYSRNEYRAVMALV